jgi:surface polysaccharide O-acyltransferase-like enzyme
MYLQDSKRLIGLDMIKIIACFLVVVLHTCNTNDIHVNISSILYYSGVVAIPLFFMTNGYLLFGKTKKDKWYSYKKIGRILLLCIILNSVLCVLYFLTKHRFLNPLLTSILSLFFQKGYLWHFWFFGALILIYLLFPLLDYLYLRKRKYFLSCAVFLLCAQIVVDILNIYSSIKYFDVFQSHIPQTFRLVSHFSYFILGGVLKSLNIPIIIKYAKLRNIILLYVLVLIYQFFMIKNIYPKLACEFFYNNPLVIALSIMIFTYIRNIQTKNNITNGIYILSGLIMVIYIIHPFVISAYNKFIFFDINILRLIVVFNISIILSWIISKIPYIKEIFKV